MLRTAQNGDSECKICVYSHNHPQGFWITSTVYPRWVTRISGRLIGINAFVPDRGTLRCIVKEVTVWKYLLNLSVLLWWLLSWQWSWPVLKPRWISASTTHFSSIGAEVLCLPGQWRQLLPFWPCRLHQKLPCGLFDSLMGLHRIMIIPNGLRLALNLIENDITFTVRSLGTLRWDEPWLLWIRFWQSYLGWL